MNSKLRKLDKILHAMAKHYEAVALSRTPPNKTDFANAEKAIRKAAAEEMLAIIGEDEEVETEYIRTHTGEVLGPMTDDIVTPQLNRLKAELRQKIKQWEGGEDV